MMQKKKNYLKTKKAISNANFRLTALGKKSVFKSASE